MFCTVTNPLTHWIYQLAFRIMENIAGQNYPYTTCVSWNTFLFFVHSLFVSPIKAAIQENNCIDARPTECIDWIYDSLSDSQKGFSFVRWRKVAPIKLWWFHGFCSVWQFHNATAVSASASAPVALSLACCGLLQMPLPSKIDELIVGLLPVCLCPGWRRPGYGWESQLWRPPWGHYCGRPAGGPGGWWPREQPWPTYCCHAPGDTAALSSERTSDWLGQNDSVWSRAIPQGNYLTVPKLSLWQHLGKAIDPVPSHLSDLLFLCPRPPVYVR